MANALVQSAKNNTSSAPSLAKAFGSAVTSGNLIVVVFASVNGVTHSTVSDGTNTYTKIFETPNTSTSLRLSLWYAKNVTGGSLTVTITPSANSRLSIGLFEYSGVDTVAPLDQFVSIEGGFNNAPDSGPVTTGSAGELLFGCYIQGSNGAPTPGASWTLREHHEDAGAGGMSFGSEDQFDKAAGTYNATFTLGNSTFWVAGIATFKAPSADVSRTPAAGALAISGQQPVTEKTITPGAGALTIVGREPLLVAGAIQPGPGELSISGQTPELLTKTFVQPGAGALSAAGQQAVVAEATFLTPGAGSLSLVGGIIFTSTGLMLTLEILTPVRAPLYVQFDIVPVLFEMDPLVVTFDVGDWIDAGLGVTFDIVPSILVPGGVGVVGDVQAPVARVVIA